MAEAPGRRKSINLFSRNASTNLTLNTNTDTPKDGETQEKKKLGKRSSIFHLGTSKGSESRRDGSMSPQSEERLPSPKRSRTLQKNRPTSVFGSLGRKSVNVVDHEDNGPAGPIPPQSPAEDAQPESRALKGEKVVQHHGEVQTTSGLFRKKKEYMVLTDTHLIRFKSHSRASEVFPSVQPSFSRNNNIRHPSTTSISSLQEVQSITSRASADGDNAIPLSQIVTAYRVDDGRPFFTTEVVWLDEELNGVGSIQLMLHDPKEADLWHTSIRAAAQKARLLAKQPFSDRIVEYLVNVLEVAQDYDAGHFHVFRVVRRAVTKMSGRSSADDLAKLGSTVFYLVLGLTRLHLISLPDFSEPSRVMGAKATKSTYGLVTLVAMDVEHTDDSFDLGFR